VATYRGAHAGDAAPLCLDNTPRCPYQSVCTLQLQRRLAAPVTSAGVRKQLNLLDTAAPGGLALWHNGQEAHPQGRVCRQPPSRAATHRAAMRNRACRRACNTPRAAGTRSAHEQHTTLHQAPTRVMPVGVGQRNSSTGQE
jgi:hypothetical protein